MKKSILGFTISFILTLLLTACGDGGSSNTQNSSLIAEAGENIEVEQNKLFTLDGSRSYDNNGNILTYEWLCTDSNETLYKGTSSSFTIPAQRPIGVYSATLIITDDKGKTSKDEVIIKVIEPRFVANAGAYWVVKQNQLFTLDASKSYSKDGKIISYEWLCSESNEILYKGSDSNLTLPTQRPVGTYNIKLIVTNDKHETTEDTTRVTILASDSTQSPIYTDTLKMGITVNQFKQIKDEDTIYIDVRAQGEWDEGIIEGSHKITKPHNNIQLEGEWLKDGSDFLSLVTDKDQVFTLICAGGSRAYSVANFLKSKGYNNVHYLIGGITAWTTAGETLVEKKWEN